MRTSPLAVLAFALAACPTLAQPAERLSPDARARGYEVMNKAIEYLRAQQDEKTGGWDVKPDGVTFPAITGLVIDGMLHHPAIDGDDPAVQRGVEFLLSYRQPDGGIYDRVLPSYNTSIALSALAHAGTKEAMAAVPPAQQFLIGLQWSEDLPAKPGAEVTSAYKVDASHPFYGGVGYGRHGRPDLSNTAFMLQALHDSGYEAESPPFQRALVFLQRLQMDDRINEMPYAQGVTNGGFIYATGPKGDETDTGDSEAGRYEETLDDGTVVSRLRCYGSMTYSGFKSYLYAKLSREDPRVLAAYDWIRHNYTLTENPGIGDAGYYYYLVAFSRALDAYAEPTISQIVAESEGSEPETVEHRWAEDVINALADLQQEDGSFANRDDRWLENDPVLITAYAVLALGSALGGQ